MPCRPDTFAVLQVNEERIAWLRVRHTAAGIEIIEHALHSGPWRIDDGSLSAALQEHVRRARLDRDTVYTVLDRHQMTARILHLPSHDPAEIAGMVRLGAEEYVPYPAHELVIDQCVLEALPDGNASVLAIYAHKDTVHAHLDLLEAAGIEPVEVFVSTACLATAMNCLPTMSTHCFGTVCLSAGSIEILCMSGGRVEYTRGVSVQHDWVFDESPPEAIGDLTTEVRASVAAFRREHGRAGDLEGLVVASESGSAGFACERIASATGLPCGAIAIESPLVAAGAERLTGAPLVALGAALSAAGKASLAVTLTPESVRNRRKAAAARLLLLRISTLAAVAILALAGLYAQAVYQRKTYIADLRSRIAAMQPTAESAQQKRERLLRLQQHVERSGSAVELLAELCAVMPPSGVNLTRFSFAHGESILIEGRASSRGDVYTLTEALRQAGATRIPEFSRAVESRLDLVTEQGQEVVQYAIQMRFPGEVDTETGDSPPDALVNGGE